MECAFWHKIYIIKELLNLNWSIKFVPGTNSQQVHIFAQIQAGHLEIAIIKLYTNATIIYDLLLHCRIFNDAFIVTLPPTTSSFIGSLLELLLSHSLTFLSKCPLIITFIHLTHKPMIICYQNHAQTKVLPIQILGHSLTSHYKGGWSPERCWSRLSGKVNKPIWRESLKKVKKYKWLSTFIEHALPKCPGGGRGFPRWLRLVSPLIQSRCILCYLRCWGRRGELVCLSTLETLSIILFQVHIWSVLTGASETILRGHTSPTAAAVIYAVYTVQFYYKC